MPRNRPDNSITHAGEIITPGNLGQPITHEGREFRAFTPTSRSVGIIARRIVEWDSGRYRRLKLVVREDPTRELFHEGGFDPFFWRPVIIEVRNGGNRALARYRVACCSIQRTNATRGAWAPATWIREIQARVRCIEEARGTHSFSFNRPSSYINAYVTGRGVWQTPDDDESFGLPFFEHGREGGAVGREAERRRQRRQNRANQNREPQTFADVARALGLG